MSDQLSFSTYFGERYIIVWKPEFNEFSVQQVWWSRKLEKNVYSHVCFISARAPHEEDWHIELRAKKAVENLDYNDDLDVMTL